MTSNASSLGELGITFIGGSGRAKDFKRTAAQQAQGVRDAQLLGSVHPSFSQDTNGNVYWAQFHLDHAGGFYEKRI